MKALYCAMLFWLAFASQVHAVTLERSVTLAENTLPTFQFLKAAAFFFNGVEQELRYMMSDENGRKVAASNAIKDSVTNDGYVIDDKDPCVMHILRIQVTIEKTFDQAKSTATNINFRKLPSPRAFDIWQQDPGWFHGRSAVTTVWEVSNLPDGAVCESSIVLDKENVSYPNHKCHKSVKWSSSDYNSQNVVYNMQRRLKALDYIRSNFCMGLPEPNGY